MMDYWRTKKDSKSNHKFFSGGQSEERNDFYFGKKSFDQKVKLYRSSFKLQ